MSKIVYDAYLTDGIGMVWTEDGLTFRDVQFVGAVRKPIASLEESSDIHGLLIATDVDGGRWIVKAGRAVALAHAFGALNGQEAGQAARQGSRNTG